MYKIASFFASVSAQYLKHLKLTEGKTLLNLISHLLGVFRPLIQYFAEAHLAAVFTGFWIYEVCPIFSSLILQAL